MSTTTVHAPAATTHTPAAHRSKAAFGTALAAAAAVQAATNLVFHATVSRNLDATEYGTVAALLTAILLLTVPLGSLQVATATARRHARHDNPRRLLGVVAGWSWMVALVVGAASPLVADFLHLPSAAMAAMLAPCLFLGAIGATLRGLALGEGRVNRVAWSVVASSVARVGFGVLLSGPLGVYGALWATIAAELVGVLIVGTPALKGAVSLRLGRRHLLTNGTVVLGLWCFTGIDSILARHFLGADGAAGYLSAGTLTRAGLALPLALVMANIAAFADDDALAARRSATRVATFVAGWGALTSFGFVLLGSVAQQVLFGQQLAPAPLLVLLAAVAGISGLVTTCTYFLLAQNRPAAHLPWLAAVVEITVISVWHGSPAQIAAGSGVSLVVALVVMGAAGARVAPAASNTPAPMDLDAHLWDAPASDVELSVVVPFYNPGESVGRTLTSMVELLRAARVGFEIIAVSDGATDGSEAYVEAVAATAPEVHLIVLPQNHGKGGALMRGFSATRGRFVSFIDADGDIDPVHLVGYLDRARQGGDMVYACKRHGDSASASSGLRKLISIGFSTYTTMLFRLGVADTQTGCKVMRREMMADVLPLMHERRFAFDLELFVVAKRRGFTDLRPAPVELGERLAGSTVTTKAVIRTLRDSLTIWKRLNIHGAYPKAQRALASVVAPAHAVAVASTRSDLGHLQAVA